MKNINIKQNILLALPVYNEREYAKDIINAVQRYCSNILVVDDGSTDGTLDILKMFTSINLLAHRNNQGYGKSIIDIFNYAVTNRYDWVITMDCDHQHQPSHLPIFFESIANTRADIISGSRYLEDHSNTDSVPYERLAINRRITKLLNRELNLELTDAFCGFKAYRVQSLKKMCLSETGYGLPLELWIQASRDRLKIKEIPVPLIYHDPNRNFAGQLEDPQIRLDYYLEIITRNLKPHDNQNCNKISST